MNTGQGNTSGMYSWVCQSCGQTVWSGTMHSCGYPQPYPAQQPSMYPSVYQAPWTPFTLEDIRRIVSEELDKRIPPIPPAPSALPVAGDKP